MTTEITAATFAELISPTSVNAYIPLAKFTHSEISKTLLLCNNSEDISFDDGSGNGSEVYVGRGFEITLPSDTGELPRAQIVFQVVDESFAQSLQHVTGIIRASFYLVRSGDLTRAVRRYTGFRLINIEISETEATGELIVEPFDTEPYPGVRATQDIAPALWR